MKIVLLGSIPKGDNIRKGWLDWKEEYIRIIKALVKDAEFIHGDAISDNTGALMVVGHDLAQVKKADVCVVDAKQKIGAGTAQEMVFAKHLGRPVITVIPKDTHHRKSNVTFHGVTMEEWVHPFLEISSDYVAESVEDAAGWIHGYAQSPKSYTIKNLSIFDEAIKYFESRK
jgi:hypothetical protein